jgi:hypothetical protein
MGFLLLMYFLFVASELFLLSGGFHTNLVTEIACFYRHDSNARIAFIHGRGSTCAAPAFRDSAWARARRVPACVRMCLSIYYACGPAIYLEG